MRFSDPPYSLLRNRTKAFNFFAFCRKYPEGRTSAASRGAGTRSIAEGVSNRAERRLAIARSTFPHAVLCVRIAPTITSNGVCAGHQRIGPSAPAIAS